MHGNQRLLGARAEVVDALGNEFLPCAAFAEHQHAGACGGDLLNDFENTLHRRRLTDHIFETEFGIHLRTQLAVFGFQLLRTHCARDAHFKFINLQPTLGDVIISALSHGVYSHFFAAIGGHQNANRRFAKRFGALDQVEPANARHA